jgi:hypothetical protein
MASDEVRFGRWHPSRPGSGLCDHEFLLFVERATGTDALAERTDHGVQLTLTVADERTAEDQTPAVPVMEDLRGRAAAGGRPADDDGTRSR